MNSSLKNINEHKIATKSTLPSGTSEVVGYIPKELYDLVAKTMKQIVEHRKLKALMTAASGS